MNLKTTHQDGEWNPKYYGVAVSLFCGLYMITMAIVPKLFSLEGFIFSVGIITFPLCCILTDLMTEVYGFNRARRAIWTVLCCNILFCCLYLWCNTDPRRRHLAARRRLRHDFQRQPAPSARGELRLASR
jgi:uncharacterized PurR-regulated membrane protein YhhQ (DUF165 family)